jgi:hypothetical protein
MPYSAEISRTNPACFLFLIDQSASMSDPLAGSSERKAEYLATVINRTLQELLIKCSAGEEIRRYFQIGVIGYGANVGPALSGNLAGRSLVWVDEIYENPLRVDDVTRRVPDGAGGLVETSFKLPVWFEPVAQNGTPMCHAFTLGYQVLKDWVDTHPTSFPPVVINISDGEAGDGDPLPLASQIMQLATDDGNVLLLNLHLSSNRANPVFFPASETGLPDQFAQLLFRMSSVLPNNMRDTASQFGFNVPQDGRGFIFNADQTGIVGFLSIGTRPSNLR